MVEDYPRNIPVKLFQNLSTGLTEKSFKLFSICSRGSLTVSKNAMYENCIVDFLLNMCICHMCTINRKMVAVTI